MSLTGRGVKTVAELFAAVVLVVGLALAYRFVWRGGREPLVVYCAHDAVYSEKVLRGFEEDTGIPVSPVFDTEATKSLGLVERIIREKDAPRCDVFWNNELLGTMELHEQGVLLPYKGSGFERIPEAFREPEGHWVGFGARFRVWILNTDKLAAEPDVLQGATEDDLSRVAIAKPLYGTTLTHYSILWQDWGEEKLEDWHYGWRKRGLREATGNAHVKNLVAQGVCDLGLTDTDDFFVAKDEGLPVGALPFRLESGETICIPNTVCIIKGTERLGEARRLVDYLLSAECEIGLANSKSRQVPLGPVDEEALPEEVRQLREWVGEGYPLSSLGPARSACLQWLKSEYLK